LNQPNQDERYLLGLLYAALNTPNQFAYYQQLQACMTQCQPRSGPLYVSMSVVAHSQNFESKKGADLGIILKVISKHVSLEKGILVQAKRLHGTEDGHFSMDSQYIELHDDSQAVKMLEITPSSFFMLINPPVLMHGARRTIAGVQMLPASTVKGFSFDISRSPRNLEGRTTSLTDFMVGDVMKSNVGDPREDVLKIAKGGNEEFPTKYTLLMALGIPQESVISATKDESKHE